MKTAPNLIVSVLATSFSLMGLAASVHAGRNGGKR